MGVGGGGKHPPSPWMFGNKNWKKKEIRQIRIPIIIFFFKFSSYPELSRELSKNTDNA
jgi:hypothetical protein